MIAAAKYHSYGNDFLVLPAEEIDPEDFSSLSQSICHPHRGVGSDGCIFVTGGSPGQFRLRIFNRDGSEAGMSGNGARCASAFLHHHGLVSDRAVTLQTPSGRKLFTLLEKQDDCWKYKATLGRPCFKPDAIPFRAQQELEKIQDHLLVVEGQQVYVTALSVGNPQCVIFMKELPDDSDFERLGTGLEHHPSFPDRTNVSFVQVREPHRLQVRIWERGVGPTQSSGTGACGAAVAAVQSRRAESPVEVHTETGFQLVSWDANREIELTGEVNFIAEVDFHWRARGGG